MRFRWLLKTLKRHKSTGTDEISAEFTKAWGRKFALRSINLLILFGIRRNFLSSGRSRLFTNVIRRVIKNHSNDKGVSRMSTS